MKGRKPKPTAIKKMAGNPGRRPLNDSEPEPRRLPYIPRAPRYLNKYGQKEWRRLARELDRLGLLTVVDLAAFAAYCSAFGLWVEAEYALKDMGSSKFLAVTEKGNVIQNPLMGIVNRSRADMLRAAAELGLTPSSRSRVTVAKPRRLEIAEILAGDFGKVGT